MTKFLVAIGAVFLLVQPMSARSAPNPQAGPSAADCEQVRQAVAQYGYAAARRFAVTHYGKQAANYGDQCLTKKQKAKG